MSEIEGGDIKLSWVRDKKEMKITFANGKEDKILLAKMDNSQGVDIGCLFKGVLESDHYSEVKTKVLFKTLLAD